MEALPGYFSQVILPVRIHSWNRRVIHATVRVTERSNKIHIFPQFSDVIAIVGNQGHLRAFSLKKPPEIYVKKSGQQKPAKLQAQIAIKSVIFEK